MEGGKRKFHGLQERPRCEHIWGGKCNTSQNRATEREDMTGRFAGNWGRAGRSDCAFGSFDIWGGERTVEKRRGATQQYQKGGDVEGKV